jgi:hypothetical protein
MPRTIALSLLLPALLTVSAGALPAAPPVFTQESAGLQGDPLRLRQAPARTDTVYFGGDDGTGTAFEGGIWDWDTIVSDPLQGWTSHDQTADAWDSFHRVNADSFTVHGDGCIPMFGHGAWQLWCGVHEDDADWRDFATGMGYGNHSCHKAMSPVLPVSPGDDVSIGFDYFNDTEGGFDYTYTYINCYDAGGELMEDGHVPVAKFDGRDGDYTNPSVWSSITPYAELPAGTTQVQLEFRFDSDGGWSDEDGHWATDCGPFAADDVSFDIGPVAHHYDFEDGTQGWTFARCPGVGAFMQVWPEAIWGPWLEQAGITCGCGLSGNALGFCDPNSPTDPPSFPVHHRELAYSGIVDRGAYLPPDYGGVYVRMAGYFHLELAAGTFARGGWSIYPYTTDTNPLPHWSPRGGQDTWLSTGDNPYCAYARGAAEWDLTHPPDGDPIPANWERMKFVFETFTDCVAFEIPSTACTQEGVTDGSPLIDRVQIALTAAPDAPGIVVDTGELLQDGFGQRSPTYLDPADVGNANISYDLSRDNPDANDWLGDTTSVTGPTVTSLNPRRWLARLCVRVDRKGPRQETIPGYVAWKQRLAYAGDPETDFVCVQMDSVDSSYGPYRNKFASYFHESEPGFDGAHPDYTRWQEILPDSIWTPGTRLSYRLEARYIDASDWFVSGPYEFEILPGMRLVSGEPYTIEWPCVLYIDAYDRGNEYYFDPALDALGLEHDRYDYQMVGSCCNAPMKRSFGGDTFNPGDWGNNGCSTEQLLGYRLVLLDLGTFGLGSLEDADIELLEGWLTTTSCGLADIRRGLVLSGDQIARAIEWESSTLLPLLGVDRVGEFETDEPYVWVEPPSPATLALRAGCEADFDVLDVASGVPGAVADLGFRDYDWPPGQYTQYARVMRENVQPGVANWKSVVHGFGLARLRDVDTGGQPVPGDSAGIVSAILELLGPEVSWIAAGGAPFVAWQYPCDPSAVDEEDETHLSGPVDYLYPARPNPNRGTATIRFRLAKPGEAALRVYDPAGRCVRTLAEGALPAGEQTRVWDGTDDRGGRLGSGVYWVRLVAGDRYVSSLRILHLR